MDFYREQKPSPGDVLMSFEKTSKQLFLKLQFLVVNIQKINNEKLTHNNNWMQSSEFSYDQP